jgi:hypothetical protein
MYPYKAHVYGIHVYEMHLIGVRFRPLLVQRSLEFGDGEASCHI